MANVQLELGHVRIANALYEALLRAKMPGQHKDVVHAVIRLTYGYNKTRDRIGAVQVAELIGCGKSEARRALRDLESWGVITRTGGGAGRGNSPRIGIVKDFEKWSIGTSSSTQRKAKQRSTRGRKGGQSPPISKRGGHPEKGGTPPLKGGHAPPEKGGSHPPPKTVKTTKDNTLCPRSDLKPDPTLDGDSLSELFLAELIEHVKHFRRPSNLTRWSGTFSLMLRGTKQVGPIPIDDITETIRWVVRDDFERKNVQSPDKLRKRFASLFEKAHQNGRTSGTMTHQQRVQENTKNAARDVLRESRERGRDRARR